MGYGRRIYCSKPCRSTSERLVRRPELALGKFLVFRWQKSGLSICGYAAEIGIGRTSLTNLQRDHLPTQITHDRLKAYFGEGLPHTDTETNRRSQRFKEIGPRFIHLSRSPEARRKTSESLRGRRKKPETIDKMRETRSRLGLDKQFADLARSKKSRALSSLTGRLRGEGQQQPTLDDLKAWARPVAERLDIPEIGIVGIWRGWLREHRRMSTAGRRPLENRHRLVSELMASWPRTAKGRVKQGFWATAADAVSEAEQANYSGPWLQQWYRTQLNGHCASPLSPNNR